MVDSEKTILVEASYLPGRAIRCSFKNDVHLWQDAQIVGSNNHAVTIRMGEADEDGYLFQYIDGDWQAGPNLQPEDSGTASSSGFGSSVALSKDGSLALVGAKSAQIGENQSQGAAYFFSGFSALRQPANFFPLVMRCCFIWLGLPKPVLIRNKKICALY